MKIKSGLFAEEVVLFGAALALGIFSAYRNITSSGPLIIPEFKFSWTDVVLFAALVLFFIFFSKYQKVASFSFKLFLVLIVFSRTSVVAGTLSSLPWDFWVTIFIVAIFVLIKNVLVHNVGIILAIAGIGSLLGLAISPGTAIIVMVALSFYDIIA